MASRYSNAVKCLMAIGLIAPICAMAAQGHAYDAAFPANTLINGGTSALLASINVPAGSYVAFVRLQVETGSTAPGTNFRLDCELDPNIDEPVYRVGTDTSVERYVTYQGAVTLSDDGAISFSCRDGNGHTDTVIGGKLTVIGVSTVD